jgi:prepilin-type N-terminal cleavage/methylation domain-containing protein
MSKKSGFTLMELVVVIAIISALAAIAVPAYIDWLPRYRAKKAAMELSGLLHTVKLKAIKENRTLGVFFDSGSDRYFVLSNWGTNANWDGPTQVGGDDPTDRMVDLSEYGSGVRFAGAPGVVILFQSRGTCDSATISVTNNGGDPVYRILTTLAGSILLERL